MSYLILLTRDIAIFVIYHFVYRIIFIGNAQNDSCILIHAWIRFDVDIAILSVLPDIPCTFIYITHTFYD